MSTIVRDAILAHLPPGTRPIPSGTALRYSLNCPACHVRGEPSRDRNKKGAVFANHDGSTAYYCFRCNLRTVQWPGRPLVKNVRFLLSQLGMSDEELTKLNFNAWQEHQMLMRGPPPPVTVVAKPLPMGTKLIGDWIANPIPDVNLMDVLDSLDDMSSARRDGFYWTPDPGISGDMNRRFIELYGPPTSPTGWSAVAIDETEDPPLFSDDNILHFMAEQDQD